MAARDGFYSIFVAWMKILLPLAALVLLSTLFLLSRSRDTATGLPFTMTDLQERARDELISEPRFAGASTSGDLIAFEAETAQPDADAAHLAHATTLNAQIDLTSGTVVTFSSGSGLLNTRDQLAELSGNVVITSSTGYTIRTDHLTTQMAGVGAETKGPVSGEGPAGRIDAGKMLLSENPETGDVHLLFTNGVKLVYQPQD